MDTLPVELLDNIVHLCDHVSRKNLRQTSKTFESLATPSVFDHLHMGMFESSLVKLEEIASSRLAKHVNRLTFFNDTLPTFTKKQDVVSNRGIIQRWYLASIDFRPTFTEFRDQRRDEFSEEDEEKTPGVPRTGVFSRAWDAWDALPRHNLPRRKLEQGWKEWKILLNEHKRWDDNVLDSRVQAAFQHLRNLVEVDVVRAMFNNCCTNKWPLWRRVREKTLLGPDDWKDGIDADENDIIFNESIETATLCLLEAVAQRHREQMGAAKPISVIRLQHDLGAPSDFLENWGNSLYGHAPGTKSWALDLSGLLPLADAFQHLTSLAMRFAANERPFFEHAFWAQLHHFLSGARSLRRLTVLLDSDLPLDETPDEDDGRDWPPWPPGDPMVNIFDTQVALWPHIEHLSLSLSCSSAKLLHIMRLHASTLHSLEMRDSALDDVPSFLQQLPKILTLDHVYLKHIWHLGPGLPHDDPDDACMLSFSTENQQPYEIAMKQYLLGKSDRFPDILQDDLGHPTDEERENPPSTKFRPHDHSEWQTVLLQF